MNHLPGDVPTIGRQAQVLIDDVRVVLPNQVEAMANGLECGESVAHLRVAQPTRARMWFVPLTKPQVEHLRDQLTNLLDGLE